VRGRSQEKHGLAADVRAAFTLTKAAHTDLAVTVVYAGTSVGGIRDSKTEQSSLTDGGEEGMKTNTVRVDASACPGRRAAITSPCE